MSFANKRKFYVFLSKLHAFCFLPLLLHCRGVPQSQLSPLCSHGTVRKGLPRPLDFSPPNF